MKKTLLTLLLVIGTPAAYAEGYSYLTFETTDGMKISVSVESLTLSISNNTLTAGSKTFTLSNLSKMFFSETDETATDIREVTSAALTTPSTSMTCKDRRCRKTRCAMGYIS
ncbi:MAG: hypothetical protein II675_04880 [Bacteroidaceae bacterium]|nr:hypothetical protein [Bacteroidaceae bacterium]